MNPVSLAKMKVLAAEVASPLRVRPEMTKLLASPANTCPVGAPLGMLTRSDWGVTLNGAPFAPPGYTSLRSAPLDEIQNAMAALSEMPQAFTSVGSVIAATPGWSETRSVARYAVLGVVRASSSSARSRAGRSIGGCRRMMVLALWEQGDGEGEESTGRPEGG